MDSQKLQQDYVSFFEKKETGRYFVEQLKGIIEDLHRKAEEAPERSRDYVQNAKGVREVLDHINVITNGGSKK